LVGFYFIVMLLLASLEKIVKNDSRYKKQTAPVDPNKETNLKAKHQAEKLKAKFDRIYDQRKVSVLQERLNSLPTTKANKYAIVGDEFRLRRELNFGHPVDEVDARSGRTLLLESVAGGHLQLVRMLLYDFKANVNCVTSLGKATPLHIAVDFGYRQIASMLITHGADIYSKDMFGRTPLHLVKKIHMLKLLIKFPVDVVARTHKGLTPLGYYLQTTLPEEKDDEIIRILSGLEDKRLMEITQERMLAIREVRNTSLDRWNLVTDQSTIGAYSEDIAKPW
jgi:hypothetical protein